LGEECGKESVVNISKASLNVDKGWWIEKIMIEKHVGMQKQGKKKNGS
jgi:hypothetical protein